MESVLVPLTETKTKTKTKKCERCGTEFSSGRSDRRRCKKDCRRTRPGPRKRSPEREEHELKFVSADGEGVTQPDGTHDYVLFSVGDRSLSNDNKRLTWREIFPFLWESFELNPKAVFCGFYLGYDFAQWLRDLPEERASMLLDPRRVAMRRRTDSGDNRVPFPVRYKEWEFDLLGEKRFKLRKRGEKSWMYICDVGGFFQSSFLSAIDPKRWDAPVCTEDEYRIIKEGKQIRSSARLDDAMIRYNVTENRVLSKLMERYNEALVQVDVRLNRTQWFGPGQAASAWLRDVEAPDREAIQKHVPKEAMEAARCTYFGGWFDPFLHGVVPGATYEYDINSAYPSAIALLPCLLHGKWKRGSFGEKIPKDGITMVYADVSGNDLRIGAMLHRTPHGRVLRPNHTRGWYWLRELEAAKRAGAVSSEIILHWWHYKPCKCPPPLRGIADLYRRRMEVGKDSALGKALKLLYNSGYGKFAQSVGEPRFANPIYASLITSDCRTKVLDAIATHPRGTKDVVMVATDGIYFRSPHPGLRCSEQLGDWSTSVKKNLTIMMPGIYWDDDTRKRIAAEGELKIKSRGIRASDLARVVTALDSRWARWTPRKPWPTIEIPVAFAMVTGRQALARRKWNLCGTVETGGMRMVSSEPKTKRDAARMWQVDGAWASPPFKEWGSGEGGEDVESTPYDKRFGMELAEMQGAEMGHPDGPLPVLLREALA